MVYGLRGSNNPVTYTTYRVLGYMDPSLTAHRLMRPLPYTCLFILYGTTRVHLKRARVLRYGYMQYIYELELMI